MILKITTKGFGDFFNLTDLVSQKLTESKIQNGLAILFLKGTTAGFLIIENEEGHLNDLKKMFEEIAPPEKEYRHNKKWQDENGDAHLKSVFLKNDLVIPVQGGKLDLGMWQSIFLIDFDHKLREREVVLIIIPIE